MVEKSAEDKMAEGKDIKDGNMKKKRIFPALIVAVILIAAACAGGRYYYYNLPEQRFSRIMEQAELDMQSGEYETAMTAYESALEINSLDPDARMGRVRALSLQADGLAGKTDNPSKAKACEYYGQVISMTKEYEMTDGEGKETADAARERMIRSGSLMSIIPMRSRSTAPSAREWMRFSTQNPTIRPPLWSRRQTDRENGRTMSARQEFIREMDS